MFERMKNMFGGGESPKHYGDEDAHKTGIHVEGFTQDTSTEQGPKQKNEDERFDTMVSTIKEIALEEGVPAEDMLGRETMYANKLVEKGVLKEADLGFGGVLATIKDAAREAAKQRLGQVNAVGRRREAQI